MKGEGYGMGVAIGDYDNDGWPDIFLANVTKNQLFHNNHDGTFTDVTDKAGVGGGVLDGKKMWAVAAGWFDYDNDGRLDLFVSNYCKWEVNKDPFCGPNPQPARLLPPQELRAAAEYALPQQRGRHVHGRIRRDGYRRRSAGRAWGWLSPTTITTDLWTSSWPTTMPRICCSTIWEARNSRRWRCRPESRIRNRALTFRAWAPISGTSTTMAGTTSG